MVAEATSHGILPVLAWPANGTLTIEVIQVHKSAQKMTGKPSVLELPEKPTSRDGRGSKRPLMRVEKRKERSLPRVPEKTLDNLDLEC